MSSYRTSRPTGRWIVVNKPQTNFVGVLGWPLEHSLSPLIHNAAFRNLKLDWTYLAFAVEPSALPAAIAGLRALGAAGANVTMPHKEAVLPLLDEISGDARHVGAVNTIQRFGDRLIGHNTDVDGLREFLSADAGCNVSGRKGLVLGSGGAARAAVKALSDLGAGEISVAARNEERAGPLLELSPGVHSTFVAWSDAASAATNAHIVINATPLGMNEEDPLPEAQWREGQEVVDLVYSPPMTPLLERARSGGATVWGGLGMLIRQAAASFQIWTGQDPPLEAMSAAAVHAVARSSERRRTS